MKLTIIQYFQQINNSKPTITLCFKTPKFPKQVALLQTHMSSVYYKQWQLQGKRYQHLLALPCFLDFNTEEKQLHIKYLGLGRDLEVGYHY